MINSELLSELSKITEEEKGYLFGKKAIDSSIYSSENPEIINSKKLLEAGKMITVRPHTRFVHFPCHTHDYVEAVYMCKGSTTHIINGKKTVLSEGELLFLGQWAKQEILPAGETDIAVNFIILPQFFDKTIEMLGEKKTPITTFLSDSLVGKKNDGYLLFRVENLLPVQNLIENLIWALINKKNDQQYVTKTTMGLIFMLLSDNTDTLLYRSDSEKTVYRVLRYIEENYRDPSLTHASEILHYDFSRLSHNIKKETGKTYTELLQQKRLSQAAYLLKNTALSVDDISKAVGYDNKSYFHRLFKAHYGTSPKKYRTGI